MDGGTLSGSALPGLGMTCVRYNVGACTFEPIGDAVMVESVNINPTRQIEGYWLNWFNADPQSASWDWSADAHQRNMLIKAHARGVQNFELFSVSPLWWMCLNRNPSGAYDGGDNLQPWNYDGHAVYLATVARYFTDHFGIEFDYVAPFNEPIAPWWTGDTSQEGCHFGRDTQAAVIMNLRQELDARQLFSTKISASDESLFSHAVGTWNELDDATKSLIDKVSVHGYQYENGPRTDLFYALDGKTFWQSEYGENSADGMRMARNIHRDFHLMHPESWLYWQPLDSANWGMINASNNNGTIGGPNPKFYVFAQFSRHIRPGMIILDGGEQDTVAAYDENNRKLVLVKTNGGNGDDFTFDLTRFAQADGPVKHWQTRTDGSVSYVQLPDVPSNDQRFTVSIPPNSINTFEVSNVDLDLDRNVALDKPTTTDSSMNDGTVGAKAVDGNAINNSSRWVSDNSAGGHSIEVDLEGSHRIHEVRFWTGENGFNSPFINYQFQYRSGNLWINAADDASNSESQVARSFDPVVTDRVRLNVFSVAGNTAKLYELEVFGVRLGDVNQDGQVNLLDVEPFIQLLSSGEYQSEADVNSDQTVNLLDVDPFIGILSGN